MSSHLKARARKADDSSDEISASTLKLRYWQVTKVQKEIIRPKRNFYKVSQRTAEKNKQVLKFFRTCAATERSKKSLDPLFIYLLDG